MVLSGNAAIGASDRTAIEDLLKMHSRGDDRWDWELLESCYHPDAVVDYGKWFLGSPREFTQKLASGRGEHSPNTQHAVSNMMIEVHGDRAASETYCQATTIGTDGQLAYTFGRYVDRFERRQGHWAISRRTFVIDIASSNMGIDPADFEQAHPSPNDPSYATFDWARQP